jgi:hypothetical protein
MAATAVSALAAFSVRMMGMMSVVFTAAAGHFAVPALWIIGRRFADVKWLPGALVGSARAALANARRRLC